MARQKRTNTAADDRTDAAGTVTVACRLPAGLEVAVRGFGTLKFKGCNDKLAMALDRYHGLTSGVSADAWAALQDQYAKAPWLVEGFLFAATKSKDAARESDSIGDQDAGFNPMDPDNLPGGLQAVK